jgi:hypothetical protein
MALEICIYIYMVSSYMYNIDLDIIHKYLVGGLWPTNKKKDGWYGFRCNARCEKTALDI